MSKEIEQLDKLLANKKNGYVVLLGGAKISDKLNLIENLLPKVEHLLIGGGMCFTFYKSIYLIFACAFLLQPIAP